MTTGPLTGPRDGRIRCRSIKWRRAVAAAGAVAQQEDALMSSTQAIGVIADKTYAAVAA